jgi:hypothetical protein
MSNTTAPAIKVPNVATIRKALAAAGRTPVEDTPKGLKQAWLDLQADPTPAPVEVPATPTPPTATPAPVKVKPAPAHCGCGCGQPTVTAKARFLSGHDARWAGQVGRGEVTPTPEQEHLLTDALQAKIDKIRATQAKRDAAKAARAAAKVAAAKAYAEAMAAAK